MLLFPKRYSKLSKPLIELCSLQICQHGRSSLFLKMASNTSKPSSKTLHRRAFESSTPPLTPFYTHLLPCVTINPPSTLLPSNSTAYFIQPNIDPCKLHDPIEPDPLTAAAVTPTASLAILAHRSGFVKIHILPPENPPADPRAFRPFHNTNVVSSIAVHPAATYAALAAADGSIRVHDLSNLSVTHVLKSSHSITTIAFPPTVDTTDLFVGCEDGSICLFNLKSKNHAPKIVLTSHVSRVTSLLFPYGTQTLVSASLDSVLAIHAYEPGSILSPSLITTSNPITAAAALPDGRVVIASSQHNSLRVWNTSKRIEKIAFALPFVGNTHNADDSDGANDDDQNHDSVHVAHLAPSFDGLLVTLSDQSLFTIHVDHDSELRLTPNVMCGNLEEVYDVRFVQQAKQSPNPHLAVASNSGVVWILRPPTAQQRSWSASAALRAHTGNVLALDAALFNEALNKTKKDVLFLASAARDRTARLWARITHKWHCVALAEGHTDTVSAVAISRRTTAGRFFLVTAAADRTLKVWSLESTWKHLSILSVDANETDSDSSGCQVVEVVDGFEENKSTLQLSAKWTVLAHNKDVNAVAVSPDGSIVATGSQDKSIKLWSSENGKLRVTCSGHRKGVWSVAFSPVDRVVLSASGDSTVRVWNVQDGSCLRTLQGHLSGVLRATFISRGTQIASCGADGLIKVWTTRTGECDVTVDGHEDRVWGLDISNDGDVIVSGGADGKIAIWEDRSLELEDAEVKRRQEMAMMTQVVESAVRSRDWGVAARGALGLGMTQKLKSIITELIVSAENPESDLVKVIREIFAGEESLTETEQNGGLVADEEGSSVENKEQKSWEKIERLILCCRDWNASGGTGSAAVAAYVLQAVMTVWTVAELCDNLKTEKRALLEALSAHGIRHIDRVNRLTTKVAALEHVLMNMRSVVDVEFGNSKAGMDAPVPAKQIEMEVVATRRKRKRREDVACEY